MNSEYSQEPLSLHDAELVAMAIDRSNSMARLSFRLESGALHTVELRGLKAFRSEDLTLQNVVSRVLQSSKKQFSTDDLTHWITWATSLSDAASWLAGQRKHDWINNCANGALELVVFEPSAGAQIAAVCDQLVLS